MDPSQSNSRTGRLDEPSFISSAVDQAAARRAGRPGARRARRRWPRPGPGGRRTPPGRTSSPRPRACRRPVAAPPTLSMKAKNSAMSDRDQRQGEQQDAVVADRLPEDLVVEQLARSCRSRRTAGPALKPAPVGHRERRTPARTAQMTNTDVQRDRRDQEADDERVLCRAA